MALQHVPRVFLSDVFWDIPRAFAASRRFGGKTLRLHSENVKWQRDRGIGFFFIPTCLADHIYPLPKINRGLELKWNHFVMITTKVILRQARWGRGEQTKWTEWYFTLLLLRVQSRLLLHFRLLITFRCACPVNVNYTHSIISGSFINISGPECSPEEGAHSSY